MALLIDFLFYLEFQNKNKLNEDDGEDTKDKESNDIGEITQDADTTLTIIPTKESCKVTLCLSVVFLYFLCKYDL